MAPTPFMGFGKGTLAFLLTSGHQTRLKALVPDPHRHYDEMMRYMRGVAVADNERTSSLHPLLGESNEYETNTFGRMSSLTRADWLMMLGPSRVRLNSA
jgi:hypothetical protein